MRLTINTRERDIVPEPDESLLVTLRDRLFLTGAKQGCDRGECGACTVLLNGEPVYSCLTLTVACDGDHVTTVEGLARGDDLDPLQAAFIAHDAVQCGFCTPGQLMAATALLARNPAPDDAAIVEAMSGNLCRCGTYPKIAQAILTTAAVRREGGA
ncbi:MAG: (2Fe-2S)-binding protein [Gemmatimonadetes bacterium]|nr:(2Fe-2S)-binding protein [Gemmatimonadota bacterium]MCC6771096.1 (2Fe-2S)-binding protein [Gemmatimonadaceae bacterium]